MTLESVELATRRDVPDPEVRVGSGDDDPRAVRCGRKAIDPVVGADPPPQLAPGGDVPDTDRPVVPTGDGALPVEQDGEGAHVRRVADQALRFSGPEVGAVQDRVPEL